MKLNELGILYKAKAWRVAVTGREKGITEHLNFTLKWFHKKKKKKF